MPRLIVLLSALLTLLAFQAPALAEEPAPAAAAEAHPAADAHPAPAGDTHDAHLIQQQADAHAAAAQGVADAAKAAEPAKEKEKDKAKERDKAKDEPADDSEPVKHAPVTYTIDVALESLSKFDLGAGTVAAEFVLTVTCSGEPCDPKLEIGNGKLTSKAERIEDEDLVKRYRMKAELDAFIDLSGFPFDSHELNLELYEKRDPYQIKLKAGTFEANDRLRLPGWIIDDAPHVTIEQLDAGGKQKQDQYIFAMDISRPKMPQFFKSLVPVLFMLTIASMGLFLRPKSIGPRFGAASGGLVPLVMFHVGQINSLPAISYLTRLDKFMLASYCAFVVHIIFTLLILRSEEVKTEDRSAKLYKMAGRVVPVVTLVLWVVSMFV